MNRRPLFFFITILFILSLMAAFYGCAGGTKEEDDTLAQQAYVKASNTEASDLFGYSVAVSGDTLAVGAQLEDSNAMGVNENQSNNTAIDAGAVYVYTRNSGGVWTQQAYIKASNTDSGDIFGHSVALSGDTLAVGAPSEGSWSTGVNNDDTNNGAPGSGAVYVFTRDGGGTWSQQAYIKAVNTDVNDGFGASIALYGDTLAVGAPVEGSTATGVNSDYTINTAGWAGAVYVFVRDAGGTWSQQAYIKASNTEAFDEFGTSVALHGDTLAVGAPFEESSSTGVNNDDANNGAPDSGAVYVFTRVGGTWSQQAYVKASNTESGDQFGTSVALSTDTLVVGAPFEWSAATGIDGAQADNSAINAGAAYVFTRVGGTWSQQAYVKASNTDGGDQFGYSTALSDDYLAVGAWVEDINATGVNGTMIDNTATSSGAAYVFSRDAGGAWSQKYYVKASNTDAGDRFGYDVDVDNKTLAVGATWEASAATGVNGNEADNSALSAGAVYVFH